MEKPAPRQFDYLDKLSIIHHELPNLATPIKGFVSTIMAHPAYADAEFKSIRDRMVHVNRLCNRITNLTRLHELFVPMKHLLRYIPDDRMISTRATPTTLDTIDMQLKQIQMKAYMDATPSEHFKSDRGEPRPIGVEDFEHLRKHLERHAAELKQHAREVYAGLKRMPANIFETRQVQEEFEKNAHDVLHDANSIHLILQAIGKPQRECFGLRKLLEQMDLEHIYAPREVYVNGKRPMLFLAIYNLIKNARQNPKFTGARREEVRVTAKIGHVNGKIRLSVKDTGKGMTQEELDQLFNLGFSGRGSSGIGTNIAKHVIEKEFGGAIDVQSTPGDGSTFTIELDEHKKSKIKLKLGSKKS